MCLNILWVTKCTLTPLIVLCGTRKQHILARPGILLWNSKKYVFVIMPHLHLLYALYQVTYNAIGYRKEICKPEP